MVQGGRRFVFERYVDVKGLFFFFFKASTVGC